MLSAAVLFDMDGLIVDTETCDYEAWRELYEAHGLELTLEEYAHSVGLYGAWDRLYETVSRACGRATAELHSWREPRFRERVSAVLEPSPALIRLLESLQENGVPCGIASSSDRDWVAYLLDGVGLRPWFKTIVTGEDVARRKPAPDIYLLAAERLGAAPARCVALEDSAHGIHAARAAGMRVVAIPNPVSSYQDLLLADAQVEDFGHVTLDLLRRLVENA